MEWINKQLIEMKLFGLDLNHKTQNNVLDSNLCKHCVNLRKKRSQYLFSDYLDCKKHADFLSLTTKSENFVKYQSEFNLVVKCLDDKYVVYFLKYHEDINRMKIFSFELTSSSLVNRFFKSELFKIKYWEDQDFRTAIYNRICNLKHIEDYEDFIECSIALRPVKINNYKFLDVVVI